MSQRMACTPRTSSVAGECMCLRVCVPSAINCRFAHTYRQLHSHICDFTRHTTGYLIVGHNHRDRFTDCAQRIKKICLRFGTRFLADGDVSIRFDRSIRNVSRNCLLDFMTKKLREEVTQIAIASNAASTRAPKSSR